MEYYFHWILLLSSLLVVSLLLASTSITSAADTDVDNNNKYSPPWITSIFPETLYNEFFLHKDDSACPAKGFYPYSALLSACQRFPEFGSTGNLTIRKREIAAFLAQASHETTGGWPTAPDGPYAWGLCFKVEQNPPSNYCDTSYTQWPCYPGQSYQGRGPIQLSWNYNYGPAGVALGFDGLRNPGIVANNSDISFLSALWFWMTPRSPKPSCHDVMIGHYHPLAADIAANRIAGFGLTTNIINGGIECGIPDDAESDDRIGFFERYTGLLNVSAGPNLDCANQTPYS